MNRVLITGSGKRVGAAIARYLQAQGWQPIIHYNSSADDAERLASELGSVAIGADLSDPEAAKALVSNAAKAAGGPLRALINSASIFEHDRPETFTAKALEKHYRTNTISPLLLAQVFTQQAAPSDDAIIINILDQKLHNLHPDHFSYTLSKAALETATTMMAQAFAPSIRVCGVAPGYTLPAPDESQETFDQKAAAANPLNRYPDPEDIARTIAFCLDCKAITGQTIFADNGEHLVPITRDISFREPQS